MVFKNLCVFVLLTKVASASEGLMLRSCRNCPLSEFRVKLIFRSWRLIVWILANKIRIIYKELLSIFWKESVSGLDFHY